MNGLKKGASRLERGLRAEGARRLDAARAAAGESVRRMEARARADARWRDRTGLARNSIRGCAAESGGKITISLTGGAPYQAALEAGGYAVIKPTVLNLAPEFLRALAREGGP